MIVVEQSQEFSLCFQKIRVIPTFTRRAWHFLLNRMNCDFFWTDKTLGFQEVRRDPIIASTRD